MNDSSPICYLSIPPAFTAPPPRFLKPNSYKHISANGSTAKDSTKQNGVEERVDLKTSFTKVTRNIVREKVFALALRIHDHYIPQQTTETEKIQQILNIGTRLPEKRTFVLQELIALSLREDFDVTSGSSIGFMNTLIKALHEDENNHINDGASSNNDNVMEDITSPGNKLNKTSKIGLSDIGMTDGVLGFMLQLMYNDLRKINSEEVARIVFQLGSRHKYFQYYYELTERVLLCLIFLKNIVSRSWNRLLLASQDILLVLNETLSFTLHALTSISSHTENEELRERLSNIWINKILFIIRFIAAELLFETIDHSLVTSFLKKLQEVYFLDKEFNTSTLSVLEVLNLLTVSINNSNVANIQDDFGEFEGDGSVSDMNGNIKSSCFKSYIHLNHDVSMLDLIQKIHSHNISYFQYGLKDLFETFPRILVPTHEILHNNVQIMCRANVLHLLKTISTTDLLCLRFKEEFTETTNLLSHLISLIPIQPSPSIYVEDQDDGILPLEKITFRNEEDLQRCCAEIIVGLSETKSGVQQLKENQEKITMMCMISPEEISELMSNCIFPNVELQINDQTNDDEV